MMEVVQGKGCFINEKLNYEIIALGQHENNAQESLIAIMVLCTLFITVTIFVSSCILHVAGRVSARVVAFRNYAH